MAGNGGTNENGTERNDNPDETAARSDAPAQPGNITLSLDATLELLSDRERRAILQYLSDASDQTATVNELVEHLVRQHGERTGERPGHNQVESGLYHVHLPKLTDAGVIEYDARSEELRYWRNDRLERWLERILTEESN